MSTNTKPTVETVFGSHSKKSELPTFKEYLKKNREEKPNLSCVFGSHSNKDSEPTKQKQVSESEETPDFKNQIGAHSNAEEKRLHLQNSASNLKLNQENAITRYSRGSRNINNGLHTGKLTSSQNKHVKSLDSALAEHKLKDGFHVYTGILHSPGHLFKDGEKTKVAHLPAFTSASTNYNTAGSFGRVDIEHKHNAKTHDISPSDATKMNSYSHVLKLHLSPGTHAQSIRHLSNYSHENEILVGRGHDIEIHHKPTIDHKNKTVVWHARTVGHNPKNI